MLNQPPQSPDQPTQSGQPAHLTQPAGGGSRPARFSSRSQLAVVAIVSSVLVVALFGTLLVVLSSHARGSAGITAGSQAQNGATATAGTGQPTATAAADGIGISTPGSSGGGGGGTRHTPTPTPATHAPPSVHQVVNQVTLSGAGEGSVVAACPAGELALSGGWALPYNKGATVLSSKRSGTRGWAISVDHGLDVLATSYAACLKDAPGATIVERSATGVESAGHEDATVVKCNSEEVVVGGGFTVPTGVEIPAMYADPPSPPTAWDLAALNHRTSYASVTVYAECLTYAQAHSSQSGYQQSTIAAGSTGGATSPACPSGTYVSGGGYSHGGYMQSAFAYAMSAQRVLGDEGSSYIAWKALLYANGGQSMTFTSQAMCLGFS